MQTRNIFQPCVVILLLVM